MTVQLDIAGPPSSITDANMAQAKALGASRIHLVVSDMNTHAAELALIKKYGMGGVLDVEYPLWVNTADYKEKIKAGSVTFSPLQLKAGWRTLRISDEEEISYTMNVNTDISWARPSLQAQQKAGWNNYSEEGGGRAQIDVIRGDGRKFDNYGSEDGANMYQGIYNHAADAHTENLMEWYHQYAVSSGVYLSTAKDYASKCKIFGLTLMMYTTGDLYYPSTAPLKASLDQLKAAKINVKVVHLWCGVQDNLAKAFSDPWIGVINFLRSYYGGFAPMDITTKVTTASEIFRITSGANTDKFVIGSDKALWWKRNSEKWISLGGAAYPGTMPMAAYVNGTLEVYVIGTIGTNPAEWIRRLTGTTIAATAWSGWAVDEYELN
jgi:hypothetical protein